MSLNLENLVNVCNNLINEAMDDESMWRDASDWEVRHNFWEDLPNAEKVVIVPNRLVGDIEKFCARDNAMTCVIKVPVTKMVSALIAPLPSSKLTSMFMESIGCVRAIPQLIDGTDYAFIPGWANTYIFEGLMSSYDECWELLDPIS